MIISGDKERMFINMSTRHYIPTTIVSGFPAIGKSYIAGKFPTMVRDLESSEYHWTYAGDIKNHKVVNPNWPNNYIETIAVLSRSGMYRMVCVSSHEEIRKLMKEANIKYSNVFPENTPEMRKLILERCRLRQSSPGFIVNLDANWDEYINSMKNDPGAVAKIQLTPQTIEMWSGWGLME